MELKHSISVTGELFLNLLIVPYGIETVAKLFWKCCSFHF